MKSTLKSGLTIGMLVAALALTGGCGDNDNSGNFNGNGNDNDNGNDNGAVATRTATPGPVVTPTAVATTATNPTATPGGGTTTQTVGFNFTAANGIQAFQVRIAYPTAKGSFTGSAENVTCTITGGGGIFTKNDNDSAGTLTLSVANTANLTFPVDVSCPFDATSAITASDLTITVQEVTQNNGPGNAADLTVTPSIS
jgi:hypothetical protein